MVRYWLLFRPLYYAGDAMLCDPTYYVMRYYAILDG